MGTTTGTVQYSTVQSGGVLSGESRGRKAANAFECVVEVRLKFVLNRRGGGAQMQTQTQTLKQRQRRTGGARHANLVSNLHTKSLQQCERRTAKGEERGRRMSNQSCAGCSNSRIADCIAFPPFAGSLAAVTAHVWLALVCPEMRPIFVCVCLESAVSLAPDQPAQYHTGGAVLLPFIIWLQQTLLLLLISPTSFQHYSTQQQLKQFNLYYIFSVPFNNTQSCLALTLELTSFASSSLLSLLLTLLYYHYHRSLMIGKKYSTTDW